MSRTSGGQFKCPVCGETVGTYGRYQHYNRHVKEGKMTKEAKAARYEFYISGPNYRKAE
jgi:tRNA(Ile2) C34 agmatinyltransferase TiaS